MNSISSLIQQSNPYEQFVQQLVQLESQKMWQMEDEKSTLDSRQSALSDTSSVISDFTSKIDELSSITSSSFDLFEATSSDESVLQIDSVQGLEQSNAYDITVHNKAQKDIMLSNVMDGGAFDLAADGDGSLDITIGGKTETINVSATNTDGTDKTNKEILDSFSAEINNLLGEEIDSDTFQIDNNGNVQLSVKSTQTGSDQRIQLNNTTGLFTQLASNMTHQETDANQLDAQFTIDGITFTRGQNAVDDAISGMTFTILDDPGTQEQISVTNDTEAARENIDDFITSYNEMNKKIRELTFINGETGNKGPLQGMRSIRDLTINLRQLALADMSSAGAGELANLAEIGIGFENNGKMVVEDSAKLEEALGERPEEVENLFTDDTSPIQQMYNRAETYTQAGGIISNLESGLDQKIDNIDNQIQSEEKYLERYEERQRQIFAELHQIQQEGQQQFNRISNYQSQLGF